MNKSIFIIQKKKAEKPETLKPKTKIEDPKNAIRNLATFFRLWGVVGYHTTTLVVEDSKIKIQDKSLWSKIQKRETIKKTKTKSKQDHMNNKGNKSSWSLEMNTAPTSQTVLHFSPMPNITLRNFPYLPFLSLNPNKILGQMGRHG